MRTGQVCDVGIANSGGYRDVVIENGSLRDFALGVLVIGARDNLLNHLRVSQSLFSGLIVVDADNTRIGHSTVNGQWAHDRPGGHRRLCLARNHIRTRRRVGNGDIGLFAVEGTDASRIAHSVFADNFEAGIILDGSDNVVVKNHFRRNGDGVVVSGDRNVIEGNHLTDTLGCDGECGNAISFEGGSGNLIKGNLIERTQWGIRLDAFTGLAADTVVQGNRVRDASSDGIVIDLNQVGPVTGTIVDRNRVFRSGDDGIDVNAKDTTLMRNVANHNADFGIEAPAGVTDGGGNHAAGNGNPLQCVHVSC